MRAITVASVVLLLCSCAFSQVPASQSSEDTQNLQTAYCPNLHRLEVAPSQKLFLDGKIGKRAIRMYLDRGGSGVVGLFFDRASWQVTEFGGTWSDGQIEASDQADNHPATGRLSASLSGNRLTGSWTPENTREAESLDLATIPEPKCDGKEPWKRLDDPNVPASFAYPASWHLERDRDGIRLTCPDPSQVAYSQGVVVKMGSGSLESPPELLQCKDHWIYGTAGSECDCDHPDKIGCHAAKATRSGSATVLDVGDHEWRTYCQSGGYVGQGEGEDRIILLAHSWVEMMADGKSAGLINRLVESVKERPSTKPK